MTNLSLTALTLVSMIAVGCANADRGTSFSRFDRQPDAAKSPVVETPVSSPGGCCPGRSYRSRATGYFPYHDAMEGGYVDRKGKPLHTLQDFLAGRADYVSVSMDTTIAPYGTKLCIPEIEDTYGRAIEFRLVDTGNAFKHKKTTRMDICSRDRKSAHLPSVNRPVTVVICSED